MLYPEPGIRLQCRTSNNSKSASNRGHGRPQKDSVLRVRLRPSHIQNIDKFITESHYEDAVSRLVGKL